MADQTGADPDTAIEIEDDDALLISTHPMAQSVLERSLTFSQEVADDDADDDDGVQIVDSTLSIRKRRRTHKSSKRSSTSGSFATRQRTSSSSAAMSEAYLPVDGVASPLFRCSRSLSPTVSFLCA